MSLLSQGWTTNEVAGLLSISTATVQSHVKNALSKLGVHSKVEAIKCLWRSGAIGMPVGA